MLITKRRTAMATTKIWAIKDSLSRVLQYAANPDKTVLSDLKAVLHYAENSDNRNSVFPA